MGWFALLVVIALVVAGWGGAAGSGEFLFLNRLGTDLDPGPVQLGRIRSDGTQVTILRVLGYDTYGEGLSPDHEMLGFVTKVGLVVLNIGSGDRHLVARDVESWTWAPDSRRIAYSSGTERHQIRQIFVVRIDGSDRRRVTRNTHASTKLFDPYNALDWSPNRTQIAFLNWQFYTFYEPPSGGQLFTIAPAGGRELQGPRLGVVPGTISWSPDGRALAVAPSWAAGVFVVRGRRVTELRGSGGCVVPQELAWSPDGSRLAFLSCDTSSGEGGGVAAVDGSFHTVLPTMGDWIASPVWSSDGTRLAFLGCRHNDNYYIFRCTLYQSDKNGHGVTPVPNSARIQRILAWDG
jgi:Tol biopolymer transport system component